MPPPQQAPPSSAQLAESSREISPWRGLFELIKARLAGERDDDGVVASINWLRVHMQQRGANPNVVRNIIYRNKGKLEDKRILFDILNGLWMSKGNDALQVPGFELILQTGSVVERDIMQLLGREKRRLFHYFVSGVRTAEAPKMLITGRPGSGKTLLCDFIQQALTGDQSRATEILRITSSGDDLAILLRQLAVGVGIDVASFEARLVKLGAGAAFAVQADAQADLARLLREGIRQAGNAVVLMIHLSQSLAVQEHLADTDLRLNTADVPRVTVAEWLWASVLEPLRSLSHVSLLVTTVTPPSRDHNLAFNKVAELRPPSAAEARRYVKQRLPHLNQQQQESIVQRAKGSFEELRTLTLLRELRERDDAKPDSGHQDAGTTSDDGADIGQLSQLLETSSDQHLKHFLSLLAVLSLPEYGDFEQAALLDLLAAELPLSSVALAFLDTPANDPKRWRCFSRLLLKDLQIRLKHSHHQRYQQLHLQVADYYYLQARTAPNSEVAGRYLYHLFEARAWDALAAWLRQEAIPQVLLSRLWRKAREELHQGEVFTAIAQQVAEHYVRLGSYQHPDVEAAFDVLAHSDNPVSQAWTRLKRAEGAVKGNHFEEAAKLLSHWRDVNDVFLSAEVELIRASIARWRSKPEQASRHISQGVLPRLAELPQDSTRGRLLVAKKAVWSGLLAKDQGRFYEALEHFQSVATHDPLVKARLDFQSGDVLLQLGRFDEARLFLDHAVSLSFESDAPPFERARYLSRRALLSCHQQAFAAAQQDHQAALALIAQEQAGLLQQFERAKVQDEYAMTLAAVGDYNKALLLLQEDIDIFQAYQQAYRVDASFRILRSTLRLAAVYWSRGLGISLAYPLTRARFVRAAPDNLDSQQARVCTEQVHQVLMQTSAPQERYGALYRQTLLWRCLTMQQHTAADSWGEELLADRRFPYLEAQVQLQRGLILIRQEQYQASLAALANAEAMLLRVKVEGFERADIGLELWIRLLQHHSLLASGQHQEALAALQLALSQSHLADYHELLVHDFAEVVSLHHIASEIVTALPWCQHLPKQLRLADALVYCWQHYGSD